MPFPALRSQDLLSPNKAADPAVSGINRDFARASQHGPAPERSPLPDVLRGVALLGILAVNMQDFAGFSEWQQRGLDSAAQVLTDILANGRFISIFAMLFGWGAAGLIKRHGAQLLVRRHLVLLLIGALHFVLLWHGDIISIYALVGLALLIVSRAGTAALLRVAALAGGWWLLEGVLAARKYFLLPPLPRFSGLPEVQHHSYLALVSARAHEFWPSVLSEAAYNALWLLALFCLGAAAQRSSLLTRPQDHQPLLRALALWGTVLGLALGLALAWLNTRNDFASGLLSVPLRMSGGLAGGLGYVGLIGLLSAQGRLGWLKYFAHSGRMAMSNYLAQSAVMTSIFYPYAGAQWGRWGAGSALALTLAFGLLQVWLSGLMVRRYGSGPMEKLTRLLVYGCVK